MKAPEYWERVIALGDIHGCVHALDAILAVIEPGPQDLIVCLGDFVDQGRDTKAVIQTLLDLRKRTNLVAIEGNHEEMLAAALENEKQRRYWEMAGGIQTLNSYRYAGSLRDIPGEHWEFILSAADYFQTSTHIFTHANYEPNLPLHEHATYTLRWSLLDPKNAKPHFSGKTAIVGHTEQRSGDILDLGFVKCIDTYCYGSGWLTALEVKTGQIWQASRWGMLRDQ